MMAVGGKVILYAAEWEICILLDGSMRRKPVNEVPTFTNCTYCTTIQLPSSVLCFRFALHLYNEAWMQNSVRLEREKKLAALLISSLHLTRIAIYPDLFPTTEWTPFSYSHHPPRLFVTNGYKD